jgi:enoyl-CoA hydratase/carnithine racemase
MTYTDIRTERDGRIFTITIDRPAKMNAVSPNTNAEMAAAFDEFAADDELWVAILNGSGEQAFCSGGDISKMVDAETEDDYPIPVSGYGGITNRHDCHKPIIAAVNGFAFGGGFEMVLAADLAVASDQAVFGLPEPKVGTAAVAGGMHRLIREIGRKAAMEILLTADPIDANRALELRLVNAVVPPAEVMERSRALAERIIACAPLAIQATKQCALEGLAFGSVKGAMAAQDAGDFALLTEMFQSADIKEGLSAFLERRSPQWRGQ